MKLNAIIELLLLTVWGQSAWHAKQYLPFNANTNMMANVEKIQTVLKSIKCWKYAEKHQYYTDSEYVYEYYTDSDSVV